MDVFKTYFRFECSGLRDGIKVENGSHYVRLQVELLHSGVKESSMNIAVHHHWPPQFNNDINNDDTGDQKHKKY